MGHCVGTIVGEETISSFSLKILFCCIEGVEAAVIVAVLCAPFEKTVRRMHFVVCYITLRHCFGGAIVRTTFGIQ